VVTFKKVWDSAFEQFWKEYPRKTGKLAARREFEAAIKRYGATLQQLLDGIERYRKTKPAYADWCHPRTWLHQGRWMDEPDSSGKQEPAEDWWDQCKRLHDLKCGGQYAHGLRMQMDEAKK
jgi:hypothetical protein